MQELAIKSELYNLCKIAYDKVYIVSSPKKSTEAYICDIISEGSHFIYRDKNGEIVTIEGIQDIHYCESNLVFVVNNKETEEVELVIFNKKEASITKIKADNLCILSKRKLRLNTLIYYTEYKDNEQNGYIILLGNKDGKINTQYENVDYIDIDNEKCNITFKNKRHILVK